MTGAFSQIVGHETPKTFLSRVQATGRLANGFLFHGDRGRGKFKTAMAFLQRLFCQHETGCGACPPCRRFETGNHPDVETVTVADGKTRIAIAQIRELKEWYSRAPFEAERRASVIDQAHLMTDEAQNSLLKLLEEPPSQGLMILISPDPGGLLETVHSRLQSLYFGPLSDPELLSVLAQESAASTSEHEAILPLAGGSPGRALELLGDEHIKKVLAAAELLFDLRTQPFEYAETVCGGRTSGAQARQDSLAVLEAAAEMLSRRIADAVRDVEARASTLLVEPFRPGLETLESIQRLILDAINSLNRNVSPRTCLESLKIRLHRELGQARRQIVGGQR